MNSPAFVTSFTGKTLAISKNVSTTGMPTVPRCAMAGDSKAPVIKLRRTPIERQNSVSVSFDTIDVSYGAADAIRSNSALTVTLQKKQGVSSLPSATTVPVRQPRSDDVTPADYYYPVETRNLAPFICLNTDDNSLSIAYEPVTKTVANVPSTSEKEVPFWKKPISYKWVSTDAASSSSPETLSTAQYEAYYPSSIRNRAPLIDIRGPADCKWNEQPYIRVGNEVVEFSEKINKMVVYPEGKDVKTELRAASTIANYYPDDVINKAPKIEIKPSSIEMCMETVEVTDAQAKEIFDNCTK